MGFLGSLFGPQKQMEGVDKYQLQGAAEQLGSSRMQQQDFINALQKQGGLANQSNVFNQMQGLAGQLGQQAMGQGPNPALAQLANTTGQNIASQASLMAGQRGVGANPGLAARNIGQMGAAQQQQAAGQAAALGAQQQLAAQQALQNQQAMLGNLATQQVGQRAGALGQLGNLALGNQGQLLNMQANINKANAAQNQLSQQQGGGLLGGLMSGAGAALGMPFAQGGEVPQSMGLSSGVMDYVKSMKAGGMVPGKAVVNGDSPKNDKVPAMLSPGEIVIPRSKVNDPEKAKKFVEAILAKKGKI